MVRRAGARTANTYKKLSAKKFLAVRLRGSSKIRQLNMPGVAQSDRARIMRADKFADSKFLLDLKSRGCRFESGLRTPSSKSPRSKREKGD